MTRAAGEISTEIKENKGVDHERENEMTERDASLLGLSSFTGASGKYASPLTAGLEMLHSVLSLTPDRSVSVN